MKLALTSVALGLVLALTHAASAQPAKASDVQTMASDDCAKARKAGKTCVLSIEDENVEGLTPHQTDTTLTLLETSKHGSLIKLRMDFIREILRTAEDID